MTIAVFPHVGQTISLSLLPVTVLQLLHAIDSTVSVTEKWPLTWGYVCE